MSTTAQTAILAPVLYDDAVIPVSASGVASTGTNGDWMIASAQWAIPALNATIGSPAYKTSALGVALGQNATYDPQGIARNHSGLLVARRGFMRVSASNSGTARTIPVGCYAFPSSTGSGIVGQTGATGVGVQWATAPLVGISAAIGALTANIASGVAQVIAHPVGGDSGLGQIDIVFALATNFGYF